jgi:hypothetical protein
MPFGFGGEEICHAARTAQLHADSLSLLEFADHQLAELQEQTRSG